jgi:hypothetical protein
MNSEKPKKDMLEGIKFEPSTESNKLEPTPEKAREEKLREEQAADTKR